MTARRFNARMRRALIVTFLLFASCPALFALHTEHAKLSLAPRGSGSRSPSPTGGRRKAPAQESSSTGLLDDIVRHVQMRPASTSHLEISAQHAQTAAARPAPSGPSAFVQHHHQHQPVYPSQSAHGHPQTHPARPSQSTPSFQTADTAHAHPAVYSESTPHPQLKGLGRIAAELRPVPVVPGKRIRRVGPPQKQKVKWWMKPGGKPANQRGTGPFYESQRRLREMKKLAKAQGKHTDERPSDHPWHPPKGGGPGSPGAGSHAVSKRRL